MELNTPSVSDIQTNNDRPVFSPAILQDPALDAIVNILLQMQPGERLPSERELTQTLSLSRNTLRDRMSTLESVGVLTRKERQGTFYTGVQPEQTGNALILGLLFQQMTVESLISVRHALERQAALEACRFADTAMIAGLEKYAEAMCSTENGRDLHGADSNFHRALFAASSSPGLIFFSQMLQPVLVGTLQYLTLEQDFETMRTVHQKIFEAVKAKDEAAATAAIDAHFAWLDRLIERERTGEQR